MSRPRGSIIGAKPTWTTTATSGIWTLRQAEEMKADGKWPRGPVAPTSLAGTVGDQQVALTWTAPATTHGTITDYVVEYTPAAGSPTVVATGSTAASYTLTGLTNDTEYTIRVAAVNHTRGDWSDSVAVTPSDAPIDPYFANVGVLLHMDGSNGSTTFTDSSSNAFTFTATGDAQISTTQSKFGGASGYFDGNGDYLQIPHNAGLDFETGTDFTLEMWLRPDATQIGSAGGGGNAGAVWSGRTGATYTPYEFAIRTDLKMQWLIKGAVNTWQTIDISDTVLVADAWSHLAFVYRNGELTLYVNGIADSQMSAVAVDFYPSSTNFYIGRGGDGFYHGYIDDLRITKGAGGARYAANFTPPTAAFPDA